MNKLTELFVDHLRRKSSAGEAVEQFVENLNKADDTQGAQMAAFKYMDAIQRELTAWIATVDLQAAALKLQE